MTLDELEAIYMDGCADEVSGNVEAPTGHFYRVGDQIVVTDSQGFRDVLDFTAVEDAEVAFDERNEDYMKWADDETCPDCGQPDNCGECSHEIVVGCAGCGGYVERPNTRCNNCVRDAH